MEVANVGPSSKKDKYKKNPMVISSKEVTPLLQNTIENDSDNDSVYIIPARIPLPGSSSPLRPCSKNENESLNREVINLENMEQNSFSNKGLEKSKCPASNAGLQIVKFRPKNEVVEEEEDDDDIIPLKLTVTCEDQPKVVVQMTPTYTGGFAESIPALTFNSDSYEDYSNDSDTILPDKKTSSKKKHASNNFADIGLSSEDDKQSSEFTLENVSENGNIIKIRRRFRCPPSWNCEHRDDNTCSIKTENPTSPETDATEIMEMEAQISDLYHTEDQPSETYVNIKQEEKHHKRKSLQNGIKKPRKHKGNLDFKIFPGRGEKIGDIRCVAVEFDDVDPERLLLLHRVMYDCGDASESKRAISKMKRNILEFNGFPFDENSMTYKYKRVRLSRLHSERLKDISNLLFGSSSFLRSELTEKILNFLMKPDGEVALQIRLSTKIKSKEEREFQEHQCRLINSILQGKAPFPRVIVERLTEKELTRYRTPAIPDRCQEKSKLSVEDEFLEQYSLAKKRACESSAEGEPKKTRRSSGTRQGYPQYLNALIQGSAEKCCHGNNYNDGLSNSSKNDLLQQQYDRSGMGQEGIESVKRNLNGDERSDVSKSVESILYSLAGAGKQMSKFTNILLSCQNNSIDNSFENSKNSLLNGVGEKDRIILQRIEKNFQQICEILSNRCERKSVAGTPLRTPSFSGTQLQTSSKNGVQVFSQSNSLQPAGRSLRSFEKICTNVECATPRDLSALHDLIYSEPCHDVEIHRRILDFSGFPFKEDSLDYRWRKTLLSHMDEEAVHRIVELLNLSRDHLRKSRDEMSSSILKFLVEPSDGESTSLEKVTQVVKLKPSAFIRGTPALPCETPPNTAYSTQSSSDSPPSLEPYDAAVERSAVGKSAICPESTRSDSLSPKCRPKSENSHGCCMESKSLVKWLSDNSWTSEDKVENLPIHTFFGHPSDKQLRNDIEEIISERSSDITMKGIVDAVLQRHQQFDLRYRIIFIKSEIREILSSLQPNIDETANSYTSHLLEHTSTISSNECLSSQSKIQTATTGSANNEKLTSEPPGNIIPKENVGPSSVSL